VTKQKPIRHILIFVILFFVIFGSLIHFSTNEDRKCLKLEILYYNNNMFLDIKLIVRSVTCFKIDLLDVTLASRWSGLEGS